MILLIVAFSTLSSIATVIVGLFALRWAYRFITKPKAPSKTTALTTSAPHSPSAPPPAEPNPSQSAGQPHEPIFYRAPSGASPASETQPASIPSAPEATPIDAHNPKLTFGLDPKSKPDTWQAIQAILAWSPATPAEGLKAGWFGGVILACIYVLQDFPLIFPGAQTELGGDVVESPEKGLYLGILVFLTPFTLFLGWALRRWKARWAAVLLLIGAIGMAIQGVLPPYHYIMATVALILGAITGAKLVYEGLGGAFAARKGWDITGPMPPPNSQRRVLLAVAAVVAVVQVGGEKLAVALSADGDNDAAKSEPADPVTSNTSNTSDQAQEQTQPPTPGSERQHPPEPIPTEAVATPSNTLNGFNDVEPQEVERMNPKIVYVESGPGDLHTTWLFSAFIKAIAHGRDYRLVRSPSGQTYVLMIDGDVTQGDIGASNYMLQPFKDGYVVVGASVGKKSIAKTEIGRMIWQYESNNLLPPPP